MASPEALRAYADLMAAKSSPAGDGDWDAEAALIPIPENVSVRPIDCAGVVCEWVRDHGCSANHVVVLLHGGGYSAGSLITHRALAAQLTQRTAMAVLVVGYRLAPAHRFPAALEDAVAVFRWLIATDVPAGNITVVGDSAGGGLAAALLVTLAADGTPLPAAAGLLSPWLDLGQTGESYQRLVDVDPMVSETELDSAAAMYLGDAPADHPLASPLFADLSGLPPLYLCTGGAEILLDDSLRFATRAIGAGIDVTLHVGAGLWHVYPAWWNSVPEAAEALDDLAAFLCRHVGSLPRLSTNASNSMSATDSR